MGDLDLGYKMTSNFFGEGAMLIVDHSSRNIISGKAPISNIYSSGPCQ